MKAFTRQTGSVFVFWEKGGGADDGMTMLAKTQVQRNVARVAHKCPKRAKYR